MEKRDVGYMFTLAYSMGEGASLTLAGNFEIGCAKEAMDIELDKCYEVMERQRAKVMITAIRDKIRVEEKTRENILDSIDKIKRDLHDLETNGNGGSPNRATLNHLDTLQTNLDNTEYNIQEGRRALAEFEAKVSRPTVQ